MEQGARVETFLDDIFPRVPSADWWRVGRELVRLCDVSPKHHGCSIPSKCTTDHGVAAVFLVTCFVLQCEAPCASIEFRTILGLVWGDF